MPDDDTVGGGKDFDGIMRDLEDNIFGVEQPIVEQNKEPPKTIEPNRSERRQTLPTLLEQDSAQDILKDVLKEKNQRKYDIMGMEVLFKPYWFFTYTCELIMKDESGNIVDSEEVGGRVAIDAVSGNLSDYLQDLLDHEPIEVVDLSDEVAEIGEDAKIIDAKIGEKRLENFVKQKISGSLRADKDNVSVAGFELMWSPVFRFWLTIKKKTHNVQIDACGGYPINYDDLPLKPKSWADRVLDDLELLKDPKKWKEYIQNKRRARASGVPGTAGGAGKKSTGLSSEILAGLVGVVLFLYGLSEHDLLSILIGIGVVGGLYWYINHKKKSRSPAMPYPQGAYPPGAYPPGA